MKVICIAHLNYGNREIVWPENWSIPKVGDEFALPDASGLVVKRVIFYPMGDAEDPETVIYVVLGSISGLPFINSER